MQESDISIQTDYAVDAICKIRQILYNGGFECEQCSINWAAAKIACDAAMKAIVTNLNDTPLNILECLAEKYYSYYLMNSDFEYAYLMIERILDCLIK